MHLLQFSLLQLLKQHTQKLLELQQNVQWAQAVPLASNYYNCIHLMAFLQDNLRKSTPERQTNLDFTEPYANHLYLTPDR